MSMSRASSSSDLLGACMHGAYDIDECMIEDLDGPDPTARAEQGPYSEPDLASKHMTVLNIAQHSAGLSAQHLSSSSDNHATDSSKAGEVGSGGVKSAKVPVEHFSSTGYGLILSSGGGPSQQQQAQPFSAQLQLLTSQLQQHQQQQQQLAQQAAQAQQPAPNQRSTAASAPCNAIPRFPILMVDSATGAMLGTDTVAGPGALASGNNTSIVSESPIDMHRQQSAPQAFAYTASPSALPPGLSHEQYQLLLDAGAEPGMLAALFAPKAPQQQQQQQQRSPVTPADAASLESAEALWQQVAASGADDQTLLTLAAELNLISTDASGNILLTRELHNSATNLVLPEQSSGSLLQSVHGIQSGSILEQGNPVLASLQANSNSVSAPLAPLTQSALAGLLNSFSALRTALGGHANTSGANVIKALGSPGPSKQHTLYKTELCRGWLETGTCRYGSKCQFAHGPEELRPVPRHPKYKTEVCRSFTATGMCAYGSRCRFIHGSISAPNALFGLTEGPCSAQQLSDVLEQEVTVESFDDPSPTQKVQSFDLPRPVSPRSRMVLAVGGGSLGLRQAAALANSTASTPQITAQDAAALTRIGRLMAVPAPDIVMGSSGRTSLDSVMSSRMDAFGNMMCRSSLGDTQRSSMDSRAGGRTSLESSQSQQEWRMQEVMMMDASQPLQSPKKPQVGDLYGMTAQRFMPGIPEGVPLANMPQERNWLGGNTQRAASMDNAQPNVAAAAAQLVGQLQGFSFPVQGGGLKAVPVGRSLAQQMTATGPAPPRPASGLAGTQHTTATVMPAGNWFTGGRTAEAAKMVSSKPAGDSEMQRALLMSAYSSGLYSTSNPAGNSASFTAGQRVPSSSAGGSIARKLSPSNPGGLPTPERSDNSLGGGSDVNFASFIGGRQ